MTVLETIWKYSFKDISPWCVTVKNKTKQNSFTKPLDSIFFRKMLFVDCHKLKKAFKSPFNFFFATGTQFI